ncbi:uncharacterized protein LOC129593558 isoform X2 [Paramacrobiotus metropolitanus]|uniref:uncharacterized protein LOC129593558 isoform X2 n=1 Tax=Paramacrobiotus metropolitanus TaxID=2943436 RepID=UPI002445B1E5|nr:uncharacterized protein LOC129593558 isoform X2 [Paramacrobiotus metropolitanus]
MQDVSVCGTYHVMKMLRHRMLHFLFLSVFLGFLCANIDVVDGEIRRKTISLDDYRGRTILIDCNQYRSGTIVLRRDPSRCNQEDFFVNFRVRYGQDCHGHFRFFLNVRKLELNEEERFVVYGSLFEQRFGQTLRDAITQRIFDLHADLPEVPDKPEVTDKPDKDKPDIPDTPDMMLKLGYLMNLTTLSVAQYFSVRDTLRLEYKHGVNCGKATEFVADFTLIQGDSNAQFGELWCPSLHGFLPRELFCEAYRRSRVVCPDRFRWSDFGNNPADIFRGFDWCSDYQYDHQHEWSDTPDTPDLPDLPDTTDKPDATDKPDSPDRPDTPDLPDKPDLPDRPDTPDLPDTPDTSDLPDTRDTPDLPDTRDTPDRPEHRHRVNEEDVHWENAMYPFPVKFTPGPFNPKDEQDPRYYMHWFPRRHDHQRYYHNFAIPVWAIALIIVAAVILVVILPVILCCVCCCRRRRERIVYERTAITPNAPTNAYGTFEGGPVGKDNQAYRSTEHTPLVYPPLGTPQQAYQSSNAKVMMA